MKKEFLINLGIDEETASKIMTENGKDIEREKGKFADYDDLKEQLKKANDRITSFGDVDAIKADVEKYKAEAEKARSESDAKIAKMERQSRIKDYTGSKRFVNNPTRDFINSRLEEELSKDDSKGKSLDDIFKAVTEGMDNLFVEEKKPVAPTVTQMTSTKPLDDGVDKARAIMGLSKK